MTSSVKLRSPSLQEQLNLTSFFCGRKVADLLAKLERQLVLHALLQHAVRVPTQPFLVKTLDRPPSLLRPHLAQPFKQSLLSLRVHFL